MMRLDFGKIITERTYEYNGAKLTIRPYPRSRGKFASRDGSLLFSAADTLEAFKYCLASWDDVVDGDGKPIALTDAVKEKLFESGLGGISDFVMQKNNEMIMEMAALEKNS